MRGQPPYSSGTSSSATMLMILISGSWLKPAVSLMLCNLCSLCSLLVESKRKLEAFAQPGACLRRNTLGAGDLDQPDTTRVLDIALQTA